METPISIWHLDAPVEAIEQDLYGFASFADDLARHLIEYSESSTVRFALNGQWGVGKSSLMNLLQKSLEREGESHGLKVFRFDIWLLGSVDSLLVQNLKTLVQILRDGPEKEMLADWLDTQLADKGAGGFSLLAKAADLLHAGAGVVISAGGTKAVEAAKKRKTTKELDSNDPRKLRAVLYDLLAAHEGRLFFFFDELDRLTPEEMLSIFRLIKLFSNFPKISIVAAFDSTEVGRALSQHGGLPFVEKIFSWSQQLPPISPLQNCIQFLNAVGPLAPNKDLEALSDEESELMLSILGPTFSNGRKAKRLCTAVQFAKRRTMATLDLFDLIGIEAVRINTPAALPLLVESLAPLSPKYEEQAKTAYLEQIGELGRTTGNPHLGSLAQWLYERAKSAPKNSDPRRFDRWSAGMFVGLDCTDLKEALDSALAVTTLIHTDDVAKTVDGFRLIAQDVASTAGAIGSLRAMLADSVNETLAATVLEVTMSLGDALLKNLVNPAGDQSLGLSSGLYRDVVSIVSNAIKGPWKVSEIRRFVRYEQFHTLLCYRHDLSNRVGFETTSSRLSKELFVRLKAALRTKKLDLEAPLLHGILISARENGLAPYVKTWLRWTLKDPLKLMTVQESLSHRFLSSTSGPGRAYYHYMYANFAEVDPLKFRKRALSSLRSLDRQYQERFAPIRLSLERWDGSDDTMAW